MKEMNNVIDLFSKSKLHDYEIGAIHVDYPGSSLIMNVISPQGQHMALRIDRLSYLDISLCEPWGTGNYLAASEVTQTDGYYLIELTLNSGDEILIKVSR